MLELRNVTVLYGRSVALDNVSLSLREGEIVSIIGANGAGKSTILKALLGLLPLATGEIYFRGERIDGKATTEIVRLGISVVPENRQLFPYLDVATNLRLGASMRRDRGGIKEDLEEVYELFPVLRQRRRQKAGTLSGGEQQMLAIGRALMARPKLLCMDEPSLGLAPVVVRRIGEVIRDIHTRGVSVLLVEQNVRLALSVAHSVYLLNIGRVMVHGPVEQMRSNDAVRKAYLGG